MTDAERQALRTSLCVLCDHPLISHHWSSLRCQWSSKRRWWSRRIQCPCEMEPR